VPVPVKSQAYRAVIDHLVDACRNGSGQIGPERVAAGIWDERASPDLRPDDHAINLLLSRMSATDRELLARLLAKEFEHGVFETLKILEQFEITPFESGYEGSPYNDFVGRLDNWEWPKR
jgi:hypothetical protein